MKKSVSFGRAARYTDRRRKTERERRWSGKKEAFIEWLYTQYAVKLERASLNWVQHRPEYRDMVDDSIQKTFLKACEEYDRLKDAPYIEAWLFKTCRHRLLTEINTYRRRQKRHVALDGGTAVSDERLMTAIDALPEQIGNRETLEPDSRRAQRTGKGACARTVCERRKL